MNYQLNKKFLGYFLGWLFLTYICFDLAIGSYGESEPLAGRVFMVITLVFVAIGVGLYLKHKPSIFQK